MVLMIKQDRLQKEKSNDVTVEGLQGKEEQTEYNSAKSGADECNRIKSQQIDWLFDNFSMDKERT